MKNKIKVFTAFGFLIICMSSCVYSLFPIYTEENQVFIPEIVGKWQAVDDFTDYILFEKESKRSYRMIVFEDGERTEYEMNLAQIGEDIFMDLYLAENEFIDGVMESMTWFPVHTFMKLEISKNQIDLVRFNWRKLNRLFESNLIRIRHENVDGTILITAQPKELEKFLDQYSNDESVFDNDRGVYTRLQ